jgi:transposase
MQAQRARGYRFGVKPANNAQERLMMVRTVNDLPTATHGETVRCLIAIELSKKSWVVAFNTPLSEKISRRTLTGCKWKKLLELIEDVRARVSRQMGRPVEVMSCYEAGYDGFWLHRQLEAHGVRNYVIDPASLQVDRRARRVKTDRMDTERLLRSLMAYLRALWRYLETGLVPRGAVFKG